MSKAITSAEYNAWLEHPLTKGLKRSFEQSVTDPENQPSQYGTVTLEMYEALESEITTLKSALKEARDALNIAADKFHDYAEIHAAKEASPENDIKVERNLMLSSDMDKALAKINEVLK